MMIEWESGRRGGRDGYGDRKTWLGRERGEKRERIRKRILSRETIR